MFTNKYNIIYNINWQTIIPAEVLHFKLQSE